MKIKEICRIPPKKEGCMRIKMKISYPKEEGMKKKMAISQESLRLLLSFNKTTPFLLHDELE